MFKFKRLDTRGFSHHLVLMLVVVIVGIGGAAYVVLTHAAVPVNCANVQSTGDSMNICVNIAATGVVARADFVGGTSSHTLGAGTATLYQCGANTLACNSTLATSSSVHLHNLFVPTKSYVMTTGTPLAASNVYKACITFTVKTSSWSTTSCTGLVQFTGTTTSTAIAYVKATPATSTPPTTTTPPTAAAPDCGGETPAASAGISSWTCTFDDEFNGTALNRSLWNVQTTTGSGFTSGQSPTIACYMDNANNVSVANGLLDLTVEQEAAPFTCKGASGNPTTTYTGGEVQSQNKFSQQYGRFEISAKLPSYASKGLQETLWLWPNNDVKYGAWPASGEFDFSEFYSTYANLDVPIAHYLLNTSTASFTNHINTYTPVIYYDSNYNNCYINVGAFNTYTATWEPGYLEVDVNGKPCLVDNYTSTTGAVPAPFDQPFFLALTQALGVTGNAFVPGTTPLPATTQVDYVRVWK